MHEDDVCSSVSHDPTPCTFWTSKTKLIFGDKGRRVLRPLPWTPQPQLLCNLCVLTYKCCGINAAMQQTSAHISSSSSSLLVRLKISGSRDLEKKKEVKGRASTGGAGGEWTPPQQRNTTKCNQHCRCCAAIHGFGRNNLARCRDQYVAIQKCSAAVPQLRACTPPLRRLGLGPLPPVGETRGHPVGCSTPEERGATQIRARKS